MLRFADDGDGAGGLVDGWATRAEDGTVRIYDAAKLRSEIFIGYVDRHTADRAIVVNIPAFRLQAYDGGRRVLEARELTIRDLLVKQVTGMVRARPEGTVNEQLKSGQVEVLG